jgi:hypothetical protein
LFLDLSEHNYFHAAVEISKATEGKEGTTVIMLAADEVSTAVGL